MEQVTLYSEHIKILEKKLFSVKKKSTLIFLVLLLHIYRGILEIAIILHDLNRTIIGFFHNILLYLIAKVRFDIDMLYS